MRFAHGITGLNLLSLDALVFRHGCRRTASTWTNRSPLQCCSSPSRVYVVALASDSTAQSGKEAIKVSTKEHMSVVSNSQLDTVYFVEAYNFIF
jgi:hypothetical protein